MSAATLPPHDHAARRARLRRHLAEAGIDALFVTGSANVAWLTGFTGSNGQALIAADPAADALVTDARYEGRAATEAELDVLITREPDTVLFDRLDGTIGFEADHFSFRAGTALHEQARSHGRELRATSGIIEALRTVKDTSELARLRRACAITVEAFEATLPGLHPGRTERSVAHEFERRVIELGADGIAFPSIVAAGPNGAIPHHEPTDRPIESGDLVTCDVGARVDGYHADFTRTVGIGDPAGAWTDLHALVVEAQRAGRAAATAGTEIRAVDAAARDLITRAGHGDAFVHGTGHGLGLEIHEDPLVSPRATGSLCASTAITVEPGVYLPEPTERPPHTPPGGIRIEDTVVVTPDGPAELLTAAQHTLLTLPG